jgi:hypothetical protein
MLSLNMFWPFESLRGIFWIFSFYVRYSKLCNMTPRNLEHFSYLTWALERLNQDFQMLGSNGISLCLTWALESFTDKKENHVYLIYKEIQSGAIAKSYMTNGLLPSYMGKYLRVSSYMRKPFIIYDFATAPLWISLYMRKILFYFLSVLHQDFQMLWSYGISLCLTWALESLQKDFQMLGSYGISLSLTWALERMQQNFQMLRSYGISLSLTWALESLQRNSRSLDSMAFL